MLKKNRTRGFCIYIEFPRTTALSYNALVLKLGGILEWSGNERMNKRKKERKGKEGEREEGGRWKKRGKARRERGKGEEGRERKKESKKASQPVASPGPTPRVSVLFGLGWEDHRSTQHAPKLPNNNNRSSLARPQSLPVNYNQWKLPWGSVFLAGTRGWFWKKKKSQNLEFDLLKLKS